MTTDTSYQKTIDEKASDERKSVTCLCSDESMGNIGDALSAGRFLIFSSTELCHEENSALRQSQHA
jgi:hypothetical protein